MMADAGEHVEQLALLRIGVRGMIGRDDGDAQRRRAVEDRLIPGLLLAMVVALQFGIEMMRAEDIGESLVGMAGKADESAGELGDLVEGGGAFAFRRAELHAGDEATEVAVALRRGDEDW